MNDTGLTAGDTTREKRHFRPWKWFRRRPGRWVAPCRDEARRRRQLLVVLTDDGRVALVIPPGDVAELDLLAVGVLRAALRDAVFAVADSGTKYPHIYAVPGMVRQTA